MQAHTHTAAETNSLAHLTDVSRPATGEDDRPPGGIQSSRHVRITYVVEGSVGIATVQLQHVHTPHCKCLHAEGERGGEGGWEGREGTMGDM